MTTESSRSDAATSPRGTTRVSLKLERALLSYTGAATAAGVGFFTLAQPVEAKIVYKKVNKSISFNTILPLDINSDGITDFTFVDSHGNTSYGGWGNLTVFPNYRPNKIMGPVGTWFVRFASALPAGAEIGSQEIFPPGAKALAEAAYNGARRKPPSSSSSCYGPWKNVSNHFLGLRFAIKGKAHYGWARLNVACGDTWVTGTLTGYAYETTPNKSILSGQKQEAGVAVSEPVSLRHLAQGATGKLKRRQK